MVIDPFIGVHICPLYIRVHCCWMLTIPHTPCMAHIYIVLSDCTHHWCCFFHGFYLCDTGIMNIHLAIYWGNPLESPGRVWGLSQESNAECSKKGLQKNMVMCSIASFSWQRYSITYCPVVSGCMKDASLCWTFAVQRCLNGQDPYVFPCGGLNMHLPAIHLIFDFDSILCGWPSLEVSCLLRTHNLISRKLIT